MNQAKEIFVKNFISQEIVKNRQKIQHEFLSNLNIYINGSIFSKYDLIISSFCPKIPFRRHARRIIREIQNEQINNRNNSNFEKGIQIEPYKGKNIYVKKMMDFLNNHLRDDLVGAYVHGSLGTYEEIFYSDFDTLVVLSNDVYKTPNRLAKVAFDLNSACSLMYDLDPLQHHGWFVLTESCLDFYPEYFFPIELFNYAKSLFMDKGLVLKVRIQNSKETKRNSFFKLSNNILKSLEKKRYLNNMYQLKALLSQFMLLPSYYVQVRDGKGVYKKFSFDMAKQDFSEKDWKVMDDVSSLRRRWHYKITPLKRRLFTKPNPFSRYLVRKYSPAIPDEISNLFSENLNLRMKHLIIKMQTNLK